MIHKEQALERGIKIIDSKESHNALFENLKTHFPQTIKDNQVDLGAIAMLLGLETKANIQGYELTFSGKALANALYSTPTNKCLKFEYTYHTHNTESHQQADNFIIKGDNLDVLKILKSAYSEKIKMIYIDPPYNTKNENFIYPDNFRKDYKAILQEVGLLEIDDEGNEVESETLKFFRNIQGSRTHSGWLAFMIPRLKLARDLLREDGVIFISIDDNEQANLKILCDEIFGEENFVACIVVESSPAGTQSSNFIAQQHSYCLVYGKSLTENTLTKIMLSKSELEKKYIEQDEFGSFYIERLWKRGIGGRKEDVPSLHFPVYFDENKNEIYIDEEGKGLKNLIKIIPYQVAEVLGRWTWSKDKMKTERHKLIVKKVNGEYKLHKKQYKEDETGKLPNSIIKSELGRTELGSLELKEIMGEKVFDYPKSVKFIQFLLKFSTSGSDIILDFFAGSGTTAHAVMELNAKDGGNRKFILVQIDEPIDEAKNKVAYDFCKKELKSKNPVISDITIERVKRASAKIAKQNESFNASFSVLSLSDKPELISTKEGALELLSNADLSPFDKALNLALQSGKTLDKPLKPIFENKLYACEDCLYLIACDKEVLEFLRKSQNEYIFIDGFEDLGLEDFLNLDSSLNDRLRVVY